MSSLDVEKELIRAVVKNIIELSDQAKQYLPDNPQIEGFSGILEKLGKNMKDAIEKYLQRIPGEDPLEDASKKLVDLRSRLENAYSNLRGFLEDSIKIPREIYYLVDLFLARFFNLNMKNKYILTLGSELAMMEFFTDFLKYTYNFDITLPELFEGNVMKFYIIMIPPTLANKRSTSKWPLIFHELSHAIDKELEIVDKHLTEPRDYASAYFIVLNEGDFPEELVEKARLKLYTSEYVADLLTTYYFGPVYTFILLEEYHHIYLLIKPSKTHPELAKRISLMINEISEHLKFKLEQEVIRSRLKASTNVAKSEEMSSDIIKDLRSVGEPFTEDFFDKELRTSFDENFLTKFDNLSELIFYIKKEFIYGRPCVIHPLCLYHINLYILTNEEYMKEIDKTIKDISNKLKINVNEFMEILEELMADLIRLYIVKQQFLQRKKILYGPQI